MKNKNIIDSVYNPFLRELILNVGKKIVSPRPPYYVDVISRILEAAEETGFGIYKEGENSVYILYPNDKDWGTLKGYALQNFLMQCALAIGLDKNVAMDYKFVEDLEKQILLQATIFVGKSTRKK